MNPTRQSSPAVPLSTESAERALLGLSAGMELVAMRALADRDQAGDAVQETITRVLAVLNQRGIPAGYTLETYTFGVLKHVLADEVRRRRRLVDLPRWLTSRDADPLELLVTRERTQRVHEALNRLDRAERELLERCYSDGERLVDIAARTGEPAERIRKRKSRALARLRALLVREGHTAPDSAID